MKRNEEITLQSLAEKEEVTIGYSDKDMVIVDSIQKFAEINAAHIAMNVIMICTNGRIQARLNDMQLTLSKNQVAIVPQNVLVTDIMISPDFNLTELYVMQRYLQQSLLREKMAIWNDVMYIHHHHVITLDNDYLEIFPMFYDMLNNAVERSQENPFGTEIIQSILSAGILTLCGEMKMMLPTGHNDEDVKLSNSHFQRFLELLQEKLNQL